MLKSIIIKQMCYTREECCTTFIISLEGRSDIFCYTNAKELQWQPMWWCIYRYVITNPNFCYNKLYCRVKCYLYAFLIGFGSMITPKQKGPIFNKNSKVAFARTMPSSGPTYLYSTHIYTTIEWHCISYSSASRKSVLDQKKSCFK